MVDARAATGGSIVAKPGEWRRALTRGRAREECAIATDARRCLDRASDELLHLNLLGARRLYCIV